MGAATEIGRNPVVSTRLSLSMKNEQADTGRDCRTRLARPNSQARIGTEKYLFSLFSWRRAGMSILPGRSLLLLQQYIWCTFIYLPMYGHKYSKSMDQPGKVASPARGQLNRANECFPVHVRAWEFGLARRVRQSRPASACSSPYSGRIWCLLTGFLPSCHNLQKESRVLFFQFSSILMRLVFLECRKNLGFLFPFWFYTEYSIGCPIQFTAVDAAPVRCIQVCSPNPLPQAWAPTFKSTQQCTPKVRKQIRPYYIVYLV